MDIKIKGLNYLSHNAKSLIVSRYLKDNEIRIPPDKDEMFDFGSYEIKLTGKHPVKIEFGSSVYHLRCHKTKTQYVFEIWRAS